MKSLLLAAVTAMMLISLASVSGQTADSGLLVLTESQIRKVAEKTAGKEADARVLGIIIKNSVKEYMATLEAEGRCSYITPALAADSVKALQRRIRIANTRLSAIERKIDMAGKERQSGVEAAALRRDSLQAVLADIEARTAIADSLTAVYGTQITLLSDSVDALYGEQAQLEQRVERQAKIKDAAIARRSMAGSIVDQIMTIETEALRSPIDADLTSYLEEATELLERNREMISKYGVPQLLPQAEAAVTHIEVLEGYSQLIGRARTAIERHDTKDMKKVAEQLDAYYREHGLENIDHIETVRTTLYMLNSRK
ncbi:MAG: hypothetical protein K2H98_08055 [Duncaniella sp.]|nr:hypothetical protein [Duncaniella sp.]